MTRTALSAALRLCEELDRRKAMYEVRIVRGALMIAAAVPGERWEIEFFDDGRVELERFVSQGVLEQPTAPDDLLRYFDE
jgi:hypothetical protein